ncbi:MAG: hypothetical protein IPL20_17795 [Saprospiraceae bacterium]|nr:hypothetical protein [Saprospiraceae bacterium]
MPEVQLQNDCARTKKKFSPESVINHIGNDRIIQFLTMGKKPNHHPRNLLNPALTNLPRPDFAALLCF